uniref:ARM repeat-containing protein n=1 Tax=Kwoniella dejecticola CBS 10117 TaxID=1296121 RepID=A0A1A5ZZI3_9TREE|nr:uncharacterized protein I303_06774 [Kwoniella dejecticola CBS 10117]OBR83215.1 hypothetical protein I303_06774 [Kwoniella dejecticola CBS 10117]
MGAITDESSPDHSTIINLVRSLAALAKKEDQRDEIVATLDQLAVALRDGQTDLPGILVQLLKDGDSEVLRQVARAAANLVIDCDENRERLVTAGYIDSVLSHPTFELDVHSAPAPTILAVTASLHNLTVDKHPFALSVLKQEIHTRTIIDFTQRWTEDFYSTSALDETSTIARWAWSIVSNLLEEPVPPLPSNALSTFLLPLTHYLTSIDIDVDTHLHILTHACNALETSSSQEGSMRHNVLGILDALTAFVEKAIVPIQPDAAQEGDEDEDDEDEGDYEKRLGKAKATIVRILVDLSINVPASSPFWDTMRAWLEMEDRSDLLNCALLSFGNSVKDADASAKSLLQGKESLLPKIISLLSSATPAIIQHSVIGLLKNLSVARDNQDVLGDAGVIEKLYEMGVWLEKTDMLGSVQGGAAGIIKNLCRANASNALRFLALPLEPLLDLIKRVDDPALKFECTRVFVNVIKSLAMAQESVKPLGGTRIVEALTIMLVEGEKYPVLQSESVIALTLLATFGGEDARIAVKTSLKGVGIDMIRKMAEDPRKEVRENATTLLRAVDR